MQRRTVPSSSSRTVRAYLRAVAVAAGVGFLTLVVVPVSTALVLVISGSYESVAFGLLVVGLLGFLLVLATIPLVAVGIAWLLLSATLAEARSYVTDRRLLVLRWAETIENDRWWGPLVRPVDRLAFVDPRTDEDRLEDLKSRYVIGDLSEAELERRLDRHFGIGHAAPPSKRFDATARGVLVEIETDRPGSKRSDPDDP